MESHWVPAMYCPMLGRLLNGFRLTIALAILIR